MNQASFSEAKQAYEAGNFAEAAQGFISSTEGVNGQGTGEAYYLAGNALLKLRQFGEAVVQYKQAVADETYSGAGQAYTNMGTALTALKDYAGAAEAFQKAIATEYPGAYRAYAGLGNVYLRNGQTEDAGVAYRNAALYEGNPDPGKSLVNLGICFMALSRPDDAAEAYKAALGFEGFKGKGKAFANLGQAYAASGRMEDALTAFDRAKSQFDQELTPPAQADYDRALAAVSVVASNAAGLEVEEGLAYEDAETVDDESIVDTNVDVGPEDGYTRGSLSSTGMIPATDEEVSEFFETSEEELRLRDRDQRKERRRSNKTWLRVLIGAALVVVILAAGAAAAYFMGVGFPSQTSTINSMMSAHAEGGDTAEYWVANPSVDVVREMLAIPATGDATIDSIDRGPTESTAVVTMKLKSEASLSYTISLEREGLGWKVSDMEAYFPANSGN